MWIHFIFFAKVTLILATNIIDVDDILSEDFMPGTLLLLENPKSSGNFSVGDNFDHKPGDGSLRNAMELMGYHRSMMNQYLCRNYIAEEIINDMTLSRIKRRMGSSAPGIQTRTKGQNSVKNQLLQDEGSSSYKDWLSKSTTLEDIYRHYDNMEKRTETEDSDKDEEINEDYDGQVTAYMYHQQQNQSPAKLGHSGGGGGSGMYFSGGGGGGGGGYPYSQPPQHSGAGAGYSYGGSAISGHGGYPAPEPESIHEPPKYHIVHEDSHNEKEHDLSDLFDIALTALAYLSFGMFIIHVIMCISMATQPTPTAMGMMMPMSMSPTNGMTGDGGTGMTNTGGGTGTETGGGSAPDAGNGGGEPEDAGGGTGGTGNGDADTGPPTGDGSTGATGTGTGTGDGATGDGTMTGTATGTATGDENGRDTIKLRLKRDVPTITNPDNKALNELARRVLASIEAAFVANGDDGNCLRQTLCENNKYSRTVDGNNKIIIPIWSLGMSWLSGHLAKNVNPATSMLDTLKASVLGLGKANCEVIYQNCNLREQKRERKKRRKRNSRK